MELNEGIILKSVKYGETSKILYLYTKEGNKTFLLKAASKYTSKNFSLGSDITKIGYSFVKGNGFDIITTGKVIDGYNHIKSDQKRLFSTLEVIEIASHLSIHIDDSLTFYSFLSNVLEKINNSNYFEMYKRIFKLKTLYLLGVGPVFSYCIKCNTKNEKLFFDLFNGGTYCVKHKNNQIKTFPDNVIAFLKYLYLTKIDCFEEKQFDMVDDDILTQIDEFISLYYQHFLGFTSKVITTITNKY